MINKITRSFDKNLKDGIKLGYNFYKIRVENSSISNGNSGEFRVLYYYLDEEGYLYLMSKYSKV